jgi:NADH-quinone oxidoreductase subunit N
MLTNLTPMLIAALPLLITSATSILVMLFIAVHRNHWWNATLTVAGLNLALFSVFLAAANGPVSLTPLLQVDGFSCFYMLLVLIGTLACATLSHAYMEGFPGNKEELYLLLSISCLGALVLVCSRNLASLFIGIELLSVPIYGMIAYAFRLQKSLEAGIKYMLLSAAASAFMLFGMALLYADAGTLSFNGLAMDLALGIKSPIELAGLALMLVGFGFKLSLAPFHMWTPDVYEGAPAPVSAYLASVSKVAIFAVFTRFMAAPAFSHSQVLTEVLTVIAIVSIIVGNLLALVQNNIKRLLGYSSIAHFGYLLVATVAGAGGMVAVGIYLVTYMVTTLAAFGVVTLMSSPYQGKDADALHEYRGLFWRRPFLTAVLTVSMLSLAGIPMTAGFIGKFFIALIGVGGDLWWLLGALVIGSAIGLYYYLRVVITLFLPSAGMRRYDAPRDWGRRFGGVMVLGLAALTLLVGLYPTPLVELISHAQALILP